MPICNSSTMVGGASSVVTCKRHRAWLSRWEELDLGTKLHHRGDHIRALSSSESIGRLFSWANQFQYKFTAPIQAKAPYGLTFCPLVLYTKINQVQKQMRNYLHVAISRQSSISHPQTQACCFRFCLVEFPDPLGEECKQVVSNFNTRPFLSFLY